MLSDYQRYRFYEWLPGLSVWLTFLAALLLSLFAPLTMMYVVIIFDVYWVIRVIYFSFYVLLSWRRFRAAAQQDWFRRLQIEVPDWEKKINAVFLPVYNESWEVIDATLQALAFSSYPAKKLYVVISGEARQNEHWQDLQVKIRARYGQAFADILMYTHPDNLPDEIPGKGSNIHYAEWQFKNYADKKGWAYEKVIQSVFDVDTVAHREYFAHLTYMYSKHPHPERSSFQPVTLYNNNLWESPAALRIMAFGTTFWMLFSLARLDNLVTFSSHSMSFKAALEVGGHAKNIISEDSRIFFQCWLKYRGNYEVTPLYIPVSMHTVRDDNWFTSLKNLYFQQRRWAYGTEHIPFLLWQFKKHPEISWYKKLVILFHEWEGKWSWAVVPIFITFFGRLPLWFSGEEVRRSALFFNTPYVLQWLMTIAMLGLAVSLILSLLILPARPAGHRPHRYIYMLLQWALVPVSLVLFSAVPCIDAITHLMRGKYLGFNVSAKSRSG
ncbi:MAG: glycosyltransferase family 2 protein [Candidatus Magasanikbacteria bacterium]|nr:glycosyltransferase family 2 protein [Candidatus Magasanikbacteria bacterium]